MSARLHIATTIEYRGLQSFFVPLVQVSCPIERRLELFDRLPELVATRLLAAHGCSDARLHDLM